MSNLDTPEFDVNTDEGFSAALAAKLGGDANAPLPTADAPVVEPVEPVTPTDPQTPQSSADEDLIELTDEAFQIVQELGGGDINVALQRLKEKESFIGRQGNELGELRKRLDDLEQGQRAPRAPAVPQFVTPDLREQIGEAIETQGPAATLRQAALTENPDLIDAVFEEWGKVEPYEAALNRMRYEQQLAAITAGDTATTDTPDTTLAEIRFERQLAASAATASTKYPDWAELADVMGPTLQGVDDSVKALVTSDDAAERAAGIDILVQYARVNKAALAAVAKTPEQLAAEAKAKQVAGLATGSLSPAAGGTPDDERDARIAAFKQSIVGTPSTSLADGYTQPARA